MWTPHPPKRGSQGPRPPSAPQQRHREARRGPPHARSPGLKQEGRSDSCRHVGEPEDVTPGAVRPPQTVTVSRPLREFPRAVTLPEKAEWRWPGLRVGWTETEFTGQLPLGTWRHPAGGWR